MTEEIGKQIRVLRLLEYIYADAETMVEDMAHWQVGLNSAYRPSRKMKITSCVLPPAIVAVLETTEPDKEEDDPEDVPLVIWQRPSDWEPGEELVPTQAELEGNVIKIRLERP